jgi:hypothetical protein
MEDTAVVFDKVFEHVGVPVAGDDIAVKDFHRHQHMPAESPGQVKGAMMPGRPAASGQRGTWQNGENRV